MRGRQAKVDEAFGSTAARELYYETMLLASRGRPLDAERSRLFELLSRCVMTARSRAAQSECSAYAAAIVSGQDKMAMAAAQRLIDLAGCKPGSAWTASAPAASLTSARDIPLSQTP